ncbi:MAG TPA: type II secretion system protein GspD, partial [Pseudoxanthomonas sp.]|nr:type II secretion system protein GspD [Pseudoxanthomonas sp.]
GLAAAAGAGGGLGNGSLSLSPRTDGNASLTLEVGGDQVGVAAVDESNTLLVRANGRAWKSIREVVQKLDVMPMQVHIEAQVAEVTLTGALQYGVQWFIERATTDNGFPDLNNPLTPQQWSTVGASIGGRGGPGLLWSLVRNDAAAIINALDTVGDVRLLQTPSLFVRNNAEATLNVGSRIPITSVSLNSGSDRDPVSQVQYLETGIILKVRPSVTRDGMVFLDIVQEVSSPGDQPDRLGNVRINTRKVKTEAAVRAGETVMLAGLISDTVRSGSSGLPFLSRIPVIGGLFGQQGTSKERSEVIVLLTPTLVRDSQEARKLTDDYGQKFRALEPLRAPRRR